MRRALFALLLVACGDNLPDSAPVRSGERLKLGWYVYDDGTRQRETAWYYDAQLDARCTARTWSDGLRYCTPVIGEAIYTDETCTRAVGRTSGFAPEVTFFAASFYLAGDAAPSQLFRRGPPVTAPAARYEKHATGCMGPFEIEPQLFYFELGDNVQLARLKHEAPRVGGALAIVDETSDDGLRVPHALLDVAANEACTTVDRANATSIECVTASTALASYFHDAACTEPELDADPYIVPMRARRFESATSCWHYYSVGGDVLAPPLYEVIGGTCMPVAPPGGRRYFVVADPFQMPVLERVRESSTRRLQHVERVLGDVRVDDPLLYDSELDADCVRDEELRCVPTTASEVLASFFSDAGCTQVIELAFVPSGTCDPPARFAKRGGIYYPALAAYAGQIYELSTGDRCKTYSPPAPLVAYDVGAALDPQAFARAELTIDP